MMNKKRHYLTFALVYVCVNPKKTWLSTCAVGGEKMV